MRDLKFLPKADLHCHLEGCARPETIRELAQKYDLPLAPFDDFNDLPTFLAAYKRTLNPLIRSIDDLTRIASELVIDRAESGAVYCEPMWTPQSYTELAGLESDTLEERVEEAFTRVNHAMQTAANVNYMRVSHIMGVSKNHPEYAKEYAMFAVSHKQDGVVSFGTYGNELLDHAPFQEAANIALQGELLFVPHAGEVRGAESVAEVVQQGAARISHGIRAVENNQVSQLLKDRDIACDVGLSSNLRLGVVKDLQFHPIFQLLKEGIPVTLGTDDSLFFNSSLLGEYELARSLGLSDEKLANIARNSIRHSGLRDSWQQEALQGVDKWLISV